MTLYPPGGDIVFFSVMQINSSKFAGVLHQYHHHQKKATTHHRLNI